MAIIGHMAGSRQDADARYHAVRRLAYRVLPQGGHPMVGSVIGIDARMDHSMMPKCSQGGHGPKQRIHRWSMAPGGDACSHG
jgi:hypothetical protein